jgi:hypothetical protein
MASSVASSVASDVSVDNESDTEATQDKDISTSLLTSPQVRNKVTMILGGQVELPKPPPHPSPVPTAITCPPATTTYPALHRKLQNYITSFQYNHTGLPPFFALRRDRGMNHITAISREMIKEGLPIQCVEATFLAVYLTMVALKFLDGHTALPLTSDPEPPLTIQGAGKGCRKYEARGSAHSAHQRPTQTARQRASSAPRRAPSLRSLRSPTDASSAPTSSFFALAWLADPTCSFFALAWLACSFPFSCPLSLFFCARAGTAA